MSEPRGPLTRSRSASAPKAVDLLSASTQTSCGSDINAIFPAVLVPLLAETLGLYFKLEAVLDPPKSVSEAFVDVVTLNLFSGDRDAKREALYSIRKCVAVQLVFGALYSGRIPDDQRAAFLDKQKSNLELVNRSLSALLHRDAFPGILHTLQPYVGQLQNERGYHIAEEFDRSLQLSKGRLDEVCHPTDSHTLSHLQAKRLVSSYEKRLAVMKEDFADASVRFESKQQAGNARTQQLTIENNEADRSVVVTRELIENNLASLARELKTREDEENRVTTQLQERMTRDLEQQIAAVRQKTTLTLSQLALKRKGTIFTYACVRGSQLCVCVSLCARIICLRRECARYMCACMRACACVNVCPMCIRALARSADTRSGVRQLQRCRPSLRAHMAR